MVSSPMRRYRRGCGFTYACHKRRYNGGCGFTHVCHKGRYRVWFNLFLPAKRGDAEAGVVSPMRRYRRGCGFTHVCHRGRYRGGCDVIHSCHRGDAYTAAIPRVHMASPPHPPSLTAPSGATVCTTALNVAEYQTKCEI